MASIVIEVQTVDVARARKDLDRLGESGAKAAQKTGDAFTRETKKAADAVKHHLSPAQLSFLKNNRAAIKQAELLRAELAKHGDIIRQAAESQKRMTAEILKSKVQAKGLNRNLISMHGLIGTATVLMAGFAAVRAFQGASDEFRDFELALVGLGKTSDLQGERLQALGRELEALAPFTQSTAIELLNIGKSAAQLGVDSQNITAFTKTIAELASATDIVGEQGATNLARLIATTDKSFAEISNLGSAITDLGNNVAATENQILTTATGIGSATGIYGVAAKDAVALAASYRELGFQAEITRSALGRTFTEIDTAIKTSSPALQTFASLAGQSVEAFTRSFNQDATGAFVGILEGLKAVDASGGSVALTLDSLGLKGSELNRVLSAGAVSADRFREILDLSRAAYRENTALADEAARVLETLALAQKAAGDAARQLQTDFGGAQRTGQVAFYQQLASQLLTISPQIEALGAAFGNLFDTIAKDGGLLEQFIGLLGDLALFGADAANTLAYLAQNFHEPIVQLPLLTTGIIAATTAVWGFTAAILANPIGLIVAGLVAAAAAIGAFITHWDDADGAVGQFVQKTKALLFGWAADAIETAVKFSDGIQTAVANMTGQTIQGVASFADAFVGLFTGINAAVVAIFANLGPSIVSIMIDAGEGIANAILAPLKFAIDQANNLLSVLGQDPIAFDASFNFPKPEFAEQAGQDIAAAFARGADFTGAQNAVAGTVAAFSKEFTDALDANQGLIDSLRDTQKTAEFLLKDSANDKFSSGLNLAKIAAQATTPELEATAKAVAQTPAPVREIAQGLDSAATGATRLRSGLTEAEREALKAAKAVASIGSGILNDLSAAQLNLEFATDSDGLEIANKLLAIQNEYRSNGLSLSKAQRETYQSQLETIQAINAQADALRATEQARKAALEAIDTELLDAFNSLPTGVQETLKAIDFGELGDKFSVFWNGADVESRQLWADFATQGASAFSELESLFSQGLNLLVNGGDSSEFAQSAYGFLQGDQFKNLAGAGGAAIGSLVGIPPQIGTMIGQGFAQVVGVFAADASEANRQYVEAMGQLQTDLESALGNSASELNRINADIQKLQFGDGLAGDFASQKASLDKQLAQDLAAVRASGQAAIDAAVAESKTFFGGIGDFFTGLFGGQTNTQKAVAAQQKALAQLEAAQAEVRAAFAAREALLKEQYRDEYLAQLERDLIAVQSQAGGQLYDLAKAYEQQIQDFETLDLNTSGLTDLFNKEVKNLIDGLSLDDLNRLIDSGVMSQFADELATAAQAISQMARAAFSSDLESQIAQLSDPLQFRLQELEAARATMVAQARTLGLGIGEVNELFQLQVMAELENLSLDELNGLSDIVDAGLLSQFASEIRTATEALRLESLGSFNDAASQDLLSLTNSAQAKINALLSAQDTRLAEGLDLGISAADRQRLEELFSAQMADLLSGLDNLEGLENVSSVLLDAELAARAYADAQTDLMARVAEQVTELQSLSQSYSNASKSLAEYANSLNFGDQSQLLNSEQVELARSQLADVFSAAQAGDLDALNDFQDLADKLLELSRDEFASSQIFQNDLAAVQQMAAQLALSSNAQAAMLSDEAKLLESVQGQIGISNEYLSSLVTNTDSLLSSLAQQASVTPLVVGNGESATPSSAVTGSTAAVNVSVDASEIVSELATTRADNANMRGLMGQMVELLTRTAENTQNTETAVDEMRISFATQVDRMGVST